VNRFVLAIMIAGLGLACLKCQGWGASDPKSVAVDIEVAPLFSFALTGSNAGGIDLGSANPGDTVSDSVGLDVSTNHDLVWTVSLDAFPLIHSDGVTAIPGSAFVYNITGDGTGTYNPAAGGDATIPVTPTTIYTSGASENTILSLLSSLGIRVNIPADQKTGSYTTTLNISLLDAF